MDCDGAARSRQLSTYDEDALAQNRPRAKSRPRTRRRPEHLDARPARVTAVDRGRYTCEVDGSEVVAMRARALGRRAVVVGDHVWVVGGDSDARDSDARDNLARIVRIEPRRSVLRRTADDSDPVERALVANADQLAIVSSLTAPPPRRGLIDRCLVAAYDARVDPLLVLTKSDLADPGPLRDVYEAVHVQVVVTRPRIDDTGLDDLHALLRDRFTVLVGHSGVGKSTLVNRLVPAAHRAVGAISEATGKGVHTSSSAVALPLAGGGWIVDTPGIRSFGLAHVDTDTVLAAFPEFAAAAALCPRGCTHLADEPECALDDAVAHHAADPQRLESLRRLLTSRAEADVGH